jgi:adenylate kinase
MNAPNLIILGPQGSGKTTQAELLAKKTGFTLFGAGDVLREIAQQDSELGRTVHQTVNVEGRLVPPELISEVMKEKVATVPNDRGLIPYDGVGVSTGRHLGSHQDTLKHLVAGVQI